MILESIFLFIITFCFFYMALRILTLIILTILDPFFPDFVFNQRLILAKNGYFSDYNYDDANNSCWFNLPEAIVVHSNGESNKMPIGNAVYYSRYFNVKILRPK